MFKKLFPALMAIIHITSIFFSWVVIESRHIIISGMQALGTNYGKPGLLSLVFAGLVLLFSLVPRVWAHRISLFSAAINIGWTLRNFLILSVCEGGECPQRQSFFYVYVVTGILLLVTVLLQDVKPIEETTAQ